MGPGAVYLAPTAPQEAQSPRLTATTLPRRRGGSGPPARTAHPAHPNSGAPRGPPLPLSAWLLRHRSPSSLQRLPGITPAPPHPQSAPRREGDIGLQNLTLHRWSDCDPLHDPRRPSPPSVARWTPYQGALKSLPSAVRARGRGLFQPPTLAPLNQPGKGAVAGRGPGPRGAGQRREGAKVVGSRPP